MAGDASNAAFAYEEPPIATVLNQAGFLVILNLVNVCLDKLLYCGLIGQLFVGILWGTPGAKWLDRETETVIQQLGYLGLIMLVYEGGLSTSIKAVRANLIVSLCVAITGIGVPMALSFILKELVGASSLQAFAAGASLSATSLGTTFTILSTTGLVTTRLGIVTTSAAMLDDVVGLVMVQIISNLGVDSSFNAITVIRPVFVSIGFAIGLYLLCAFGIKPVLKKVLAMKFKTPSFVGTMQFAFLYQTVILVGLVAGATYAGTSSLFAAYLAGVIVSWLDEILMHSQVLDSSASLQTGPSTSTQVNNTHTHTERPRAGASNKGLIGECVYDKYYKQPIKRILIPLFFASIGFAIPITEMFKGRVVWRGIIYAVLMIFGKMITGIWLVRFSLSPISNLASNIRHRLASVCLVCKPTKDKKQRKKKKTQSKHLRSSRKSTRTLDVGFFKNKGAGPRDESTSTSTERTSRSQIEMQDHLTIPPNQPTALTAYSKPRSLYPSSILGLAMVARGEVGYLIASLAQNKGIFSSGSSDEIPEIYLVVIWAISICTLVGPICVGTLVKRVKKLQTMRTTDSPNPLGLWGI